MSIRILIACEYPSFVNTARQALSGFDCELLLSSEISLALYLAHKNVPDLILCHNSIAANSSIDFINEIKSDPDLAAIPIFLVGQTDSMPVFKSISGYLDETLDSSSLLSKIAPYLQEHVLERQAQTPE